MTNYNLLFCYLPILYENRTCYRPFRSDGDIGRPYGRSYSVNIWSNLGTLRPKIVVCVRNELCLIGRTVPDMFGAQNGSSVAFWWTIWSYFAQNAQKLRALGLLAGVFPGGFPPGLFAWLGLVVPFWEPPIPRLIMCIGLSPMSYCTLAGFCHARMQNEILHPLLLRRR